MLLNECSNSAALLANLLESGAITQETVDAILQKQEAEERMKLINDYEYKIFESGGRWYVRLPDGRRVKRKNKEDLEKIVFEIQRERTAEKRREKEKADHTMVRIFEAWNAERLATGVVSDATAIRDKRTFEKYFSDPSIAVPIEDISREAWTEYLQGIIDGRITAKEWGRIKWILRGGVLRSCPFLRRVTRRVTQGQITEILQNVKSEKPPK